MTEINSNFITVYYDKALALERLGQKEKAIEAYLLFVQHATPEQSVYIDIAKRRIQALQK